MLPEFYLNYLKTYLPSSEFLTLQILVWLLQVHRQVRIERLASSFPYPPEYINRLKLEGKNRPRHSYFWTGLYGTTWVLSMDICWDWGEKLMRTSINKLPFAQRGLKAMKLIQSKL